MNRIALYRNILEACRWFMKWMLILLVLQWLFRFFEFFLSKYYQTPYSLANLAGGMILDFGFSFNIAAGLLPIYLFLTILSVRFARFFFQALLLVMGMSAYGLSRYFALMSYPLDKVLFTYPLSEILNFAQTDGGIDLFLIISIILLVIVVFGLFVLLKKWKPARSAIGFSLLLIVVSPLINRPLNNLISKRYSRNYYLTSVNKSDYLIREFFKYLEDKKHIQRDPDKTTVSEFQSWFPDRDFTDKQFPLMHRPKEGSTLAHFIDKADTPPNIVLIIVESLTRCYSGPNAIKGSYTPFLDSLAHVGLYWENFLSTSERTVGAMPGVLASLPSSVEGFTTMAGNMPDFLGLVSILKSNNYQTNYFYGGIASSDNFNVFLSRQSIDHMQTGDYYTKNGTVYYGFNDSILYRRSLGFMQDSLHKPFLNIYLTLSTHGRSDYPSKGKLQRYVWDKWSKKLDAEKKAYLRNNLTLLTDYYYADRQIRRLFYAMKKNGDLKNTLFIVTGDHGLAKACPHNPIKKYHIPLVVYAPQIRQPKSFKAINSHYNITPALLAFLKSNYQLKTPKQVHWLGGDLDTSQSLESRIPIPFMQVNRSVDEMLFQNCFLTSGKLYKVHDNMRLEACEDDSVMRGMEALLTAYVQVNRYVCMQNHLVPKEIYKQWGNFYVDIWSSYAEELTIDTSDTYIGLWQRELKYPHENYRIKLEFDLVANTVNPKRYPSFVLEFLDSNKHKVSYSNLEWVNEWQHPDTGKNIHYLLSLETSIPADFSQTKAFIKAYLWNSKQVQLNLKNVKIHVLREIEQQKENNPVN